MQNLSRKIKGKVNRGGKEHVFVDKIILELILKRCANVSEKELVQASA
jgi:hypothetical protein